MQASPTGGTRRRSPVQMCLGDESPCSLGTGGALGLLYWLASTMHQISLQQTFASVPSTTSQYIITALVLFLSGGRSQCQPQRRLPSTSALDDDDEARHPSEWPRGTSIALKKFLESCPSIKLWQREEWSAAFDATGDSRKEEKA
jgi:hypothetical protein